MANNKNNNTGQNTSPSSRSNNVGNKSNQISELDLINVNADKAKKELGSVFSYINDNLKNINKDTDKSINSLTKKALSANKTVFNDLFKSLDKYSDKLDDTLNKLNSLGTGTSSGVTASANSPKFSNVVYDKAIFNNATFNHSVFNDVVINEKNRPQKPQIVDYSGRPIDSGKNIGSTRKEYSNSDSGFSGYGKLDKEFDYQPGNISIPNNKWRMMVNDKREELRPIYEKADWLTNRGQLMDTEKLTKFLSIGKDVKDIGKTLLNFAKPYWEKAKGAFEQNYTKVAGLTSPEQAGTGGFMGINTGTDMFNDMLDSTVAKFGDEAFNYSSEMIPAMTKALEQGFKGQEAITKAQNDMVASKILPWMDTQSEAWVNMSFNIDKNSLDQLKNQQLMIKQSEQGNRLLQDGIINYLTSDLAPLMTDIESGVAAATGYQSLGQYTSLMEAYEKQGMSSNDAYQAAKEVMGAQKDVYGALTSGNVNQILLGAEFGAGAGVNEAVGNSTVGLANIGAQANEAGDIIGGAAVANALGYKGMLAGGWTQTANQLTVTGSDTDYQLGGTEKIDALTENISNYNTEDTKYKNKMENTVADATQFMKNFPTQAISEIASTTKQILGSVISIALTNAAFKVPGVGGIGGSMLNASMMANMSGTSGGIGGAGGMITPMAATSRLSSLGNAIKGSGFLRSGGLGAMSTGSKFLSGASIAGGLINTGIEGYSGYKSAEEWGTSKGAGVAGGILGGSKGGLGNALTHGLGWAALGFGLGGPVGAAIGGILGIVTGAIGGDTIAKGIDSLFGTGPQKDSQEVLNLAKKYEKSGYFKKDALSVARNIAGKSHFSGLSFVPEDNYTANLHKGEMVATAKTASKLRKRGITGKETTDELIDSKLNNTIDFSSITSILEVISDKVSEATDKIAPKTKQLNVKFNNKVNTKLNTDEE